MIDWSLFGPLLTLWALSLSVLGGLSWALVGNQALFIGLGLGLFFLTARYPYERQRYLTRYYLFIVAGLLILPFIFGIATRGAVRWIPLGGYSLQPSELVKPLLIIIFADYLRRGLPLIGYLGLLLVPFGLIFKQPDLGTSLVVAVIWLVMLLAGRLNWKQAGALGLAIAVGLPLGFSLLKPYQKQRLISFADPYSDPAGSGYQVIQSLIAAGSGGLFGQGLGKGSQSQLKFLPERQTDFIFSAVGEELGFVGAGGLIVAYIFLLRRLVFIGKQSPDEFGRLIAIGVAAGLWFQAVVAIGMNLGWLPVTGITLPLVSAGGSSLLATMVSLGLVSSVWQARKSGL